MGLRYTVAQCEAILLEDIRKHKTGLSRCVTRPLTQNQSDAVLSFAFNVGVTKACKSTLVRKINAGDFNGAALEFPKWKYGTIGGQSVVLPGLVKRRAAEQALFRTPGGKSNNAADLKRLLTYS